MHHRTEINQLSLLVSRGDGEVFNSLQTLEIIALQGDQCKSLNDDASLDSYNDGCNDCVHKAGGMRDVHLILEGF